MVAWRKQVCKALLLAWLALAAGCAVNPVTGEKELALVSTEAEIRMGIKQYPHLRQMQGVPDVVHSQAAAYVKEVGQKLAAVSDRQLPYEFSLINNGTPNAWALPGGKIGINRGLLTELESEAQLAAVLGHEIVHAAARHSAKQLQRGLMLQGVVLATGIATQGSEYSSLAVGGTSLAAGLLTHKYSRDAEREADYYGMQYMARAGYDPRAAVELQQTFVRLSEEKATSWLQGLFASHPPSQKRVAANKETAAQLPQGGRIGRQAYEQRLAGLLADEKAYEAYAEGRQAYQQGDLQQAAALARQALDQQPREALFYGLLGDVFRKQQQYQQAVSHYGAALKRNPEYFDFYLKRGLSRLQLAEAAAAEKDLRQSLELLPTAPAYHGLGQIALRQGQRQQAKDYFAQAAQASDSQVGKAAYQAYVRLDVADSPEEYVTVDLARDRQGYLQLRVHNQTHLTLKNIVVRVRFVGSGGQGRQVDLRLPFRLPSDTSRVLDSGIGPLGAEPQVGAKVVQAALADE